MKVPKRFKLFGQTYTVEILDDYEDGSDSQGVVSHLNVRQADHPPVSELEDYWLLRNQFFDVSNSNRQGARMLRLKINLA